jgi:hypothetical protein
MTDDEMPERLLHVKDEEVPFERFITPEEKVKREEQAKAEEGIILAVHVDCEQIPTS